MECHSKKVFYWIYGMLCVFLLSIFLIIMCIANKPVLYKKLTLISFEKNKEILKDVANVLENEMHSYMYISGEDKNGFEIYDDIEGIKYITLSDSQMDDVRNVIDELNYIYIQKSGNIIFFNKYSKWSWGYGIAYSIDDNPPDGSAGSEVRTWMNLEPHWYYYEVE